MDSLTQGDRHDTGQRDRQLVAEVLERQSGAFERLVERHQRLVWHLVYRMVQHPEDTRDLCQEVFLRVHQRLAQFRFESALGTWIGRIAFSVAARHLEKKRLPLADFPEDDAGEPLVERVGDNFDLEAVCANEDMMRVLHEALATLPPLPRTLLTLYHLQELSIAEVATVVELPEGTVKSYLSRARTRLRAQLDSMLGGAG